MQPFINFKSLINNNLLFLIVYFKRIDWHNPFKIREFVAVSIE
jgi:hypothetical protein